MRVRHVAAVVAITVAAGAFLAACAPAASGGATPTASESVDLSPSPSVTPSPTATGSPEPTPTPEARLTDEPAVESHEGEPSKASTPRKYVWAPTAGQPTYYPEVGPPSNSDGTVGSGCHPPASDTLPDGVWRGSVYDKSFQETPRWIKFDLVCSYSFQYSDAPQGQEGYWYMGDDWSYVITNDNPQTRILPVADDAIGYGTTWDWAPVAWDETWLGCGLGCDTWIWINDGEVTELAAPYDWSDWWRAHKEGTW